jgi:hypothetical protein
MTNPSQSERHCLRGTGYSTQVKYVNGMRASLRPSKVTLECCLETSKANCPVTRIHITESSESPTDE